MTERIAKTVFAVLIRNKPIQVYKRNGTYVYRTANGNWKGIGNRELIRLYNDGWDEFRTHPEQQIEDGMGL